MYETTRVVGCELRDFGPEHDGTALIDAADRVLHEAKERAKGWSDEEPAADFTIGGRQWEAVEVVSGHCVLLNDGPEYLLLDIDNFRQYAWIRFAEKAPKATLNRLSVHTYQRLLALQRLAALWV